MGPVVFVTHSNSKNESLEAAFSEGLLDGIMHARSKDRVFVKHSTSQDKLRDTLRVSSRQKARRVSKT